MAGTHNVGVRNTSLDLLRGVAVAAMIVDHVTLMAFAVQDLGWNGRAIGRVAEPLFAVIFGYLLVGRSAREVARRGRQVLLAEIVVAPIFFGVVTRFDILATFLLVYALFLAVRRHFVWLLPFGLLSLWDPTARWLEYPLLMVASQVACGMLLHRPRGLWWAMVPAVSPLVMPPLVAVPLLVTVPAAWLVALALRRPDWRFAPLEAIGQHPLVWYVAHLYVVVAIAFASGRLGGPNFVEFMMTRTYTKVIPIVAP